MSSHSHSDRRQSSDRRGQPDRRTRVEDRHEVRMSSWPEQVTQFVTRYLFFALGLTFFNYSSEFTSQWMSLTQVNFAYVTYAILITVLFAHARRYPHSLTRFRLAMAVDVCIVSISLLNDPYPIPPSLLAFIMVTIGNGMRYGMRLFAECMAACFSAALLIMSIRSWYGQQPWDVGVIFLILFSGIIMIYAYILMNQIESSRWQLEQHSRIDMLTGLLNRRGLFEVAEPRFNELAGNAHRHSVMLADLDKFKAINDRYGHHIGDQVLREFAELLATSTRDKDAVARYGGDEFVLLMVDTDHDQARAISERIQAKVDVWSQHNGYGCSVSIGVGEAPRHGESLAELLEHVDQAMYRCKGDGSRPELRVAYRNPEPELV